MVHLIFGSAPFFNKKVVEFTSPDMIDLYRGVQPHSSNSFIFDKSLQKI